MRSGRLCVCWGFARFVLMAALAAGVVAYDAQQRAWLALEQDARQVLEFVFVDRPNRERLEALVLPYLCNPELHSMRRLRRLLRKVAPQLDYSERSISVMLPRLQVVPVLSIGEALQLWYGTPQIARLLEAERATRALRSSSPSWVPDIATSALAVRSASVATRTLYLRGESSASIDLFVDEAGLFSEQSRSAGATQVYATLGEFPWWFRELTHAWVKVAALPKEAVGVVGMPRLFGAVLCAAWRGMDARGFQVRDAATGAVKEIKPRLGQLLLDQKGQQELFGLGTGPTAYAHCWMCWIQEESLKLGLAADDERFVCTLADFEARNQKGGKKLRTLLESLERCGAIPSAEDCDLGLLFPLDLLHLFFGSGGIAVKLLRIVLACWPRGRRGSLPSSFLSRTQRKRVGSRLVKALGEKPERLMKVSAETKRTLFAHIVWGLEGIVRREQHCYVENLREFQLILGIEEALERDASPGSLEALEKACRSALEGARQLYGAAVVGTSKFHRLTHIVHPAPKQLRAQSARRWQRQRYRFRPTLRWSACWPGERQQKRSKWAARKTWRARHGKDGRDTRHLRAAQVEAERQCFLLQKGECFGKARVPQAGEWWRVRRFVRGEVEFGVVHVQAGPCAASLVESRAAVVQLRPSGARAPRLTLAPVPAARLPQTDFVEPLQVIPAPLPQAREAGEFCVLPGCPSLPQDAQARQRRRTIREADSSESDGSDTPDAGELDGSSDCTYVPS